MSSHTPQPPSSNHLPAVLLFLAAIGVPGAAAFKFADTISKNPWQAFAIALLYEIGIVVLAFLRKVWQHLEDEWSKGTADWVNNLVQKQWFSYKRYYARFLTFQHRDFDIKGLSTQSIYTLELEQVFVDLSIDPKPMHQVSPNPFPSQPAGASIPEELRTGGHSLWNYLTANQLKNQHVVILGAPGSGKTTLLKHLALTLVNHKKRRSLSRDVKGAYRLPFFLFLREHAENIHTDPHFSLATAIQNTLERWERPVPEGWVRRQLSRGKCLILLDGLDEVGDASLRAEVVKWVQQQMQTYATNRFLVSSRPFGYRSNPLSGVMILDVRPFNFEQVQRFVHNWYQANEVMSSQKVDPGVRMRAKEGAQDLVRRIQQSSALSSMAVNPLLLTMIATIHRYRSTLPGKRVELYAEICDVFLGKRQQARDMKVDLSPAQCVRVLQPLAYEMMRREQREISTLEAQKIIQGPLKLVHKQMTPEAFLQMVENMSGLLLEREQGKHYFAHLTFQEYLAATFIRDQGREAELLAHLGESWWEETTRLYCAQTDATTVIAACLNHPTLSAPYLMLAFECHEEALLVQPTIKPQLDRILEQGAEDADPQRRKVVAETLLKRRLKEMEPLQQGIYRDTSLILCAEYQLFLDEQRAQDRYYQPDHWTRFQFAPGQALLPIIGVRPSAAQAFCDWLTDREQGIWQYRLSRPGEYQAEKILLRPEWLPSGTWNTPYGYWQEQKSTFAWVSQPTLQATIPSRELFVSNSPLDLDFASMNLSIAPVKITEMSRFISYLEYAHDLALALDLASDRDHDLASDLALDLASDLARARRASSSDLASDLGHARDRGYDLALASASALALARTLVHDLAHALTSDRDLALDLALTSDRDLALDRAHDLAHASTLIFDLNSTKEKHFSYFLEIALLLDLLSVCVSFSTYELFMLTYNSDYRPFRKRLFAFRKKKETFPPEVQDILNKGVEIHQRLERLKKRRQGEELACEGILIIKERKQDV